MSGTMEIPSTVSALTIAHWKTNYNYHALRFSSEIQQAILDRGPKSFAGNSLGCGYSAWHSLWRFSPIKNMLRPLFNNDRKRFNMAYWKLPDVIAETPEVAFEAFILMESRLMKTHRMQGYRIAGANAIQALVRDLVQEEPKISSASDFVLLAVDFEGDPRDEKGVSEFGMAILDTRSIFPTQGDQYGEGDITSHHWISARHRGRKSLFCKSVKTCQDLLVDQIKDHIPIDRQIIVVRQSVDTDLRSLADLGMPIEDIPGIIGTVEICALAKRILDTKGSLESLLFKLRIPYMHLHTAINDAHFALQALLGLLYVQHRQTAACGSSRHPLFRLDEIARAHLPPAPALQEDEHGEEGTDEYLDGLDIFD